MYHFNQYHFNQNGGGGLPPVCGGYVHTGSPQTRINDSVFKKSNMMSYQ